MSYFSFFKNKPMTSVVIVLAAAMIAALSVSLFFPHSIPFLLPVAKGIAAKLGTVGDKIANTSVACASVVGGVVAKKKIKKIGAQLHRQETMLDLHEDGGSGGEQYDSDIDRLSPVNSP